MVRLAPSCDASFPCALETAAAVDADSDASDADSDLCDPAESGVMRAVSRLEPLDDEESFDVETFVAMSGSAPPPPVRDGDAS